MTRLGRRAEPELEIHVSYAGICFYRRRLYVDLFHGLLSSNDRHNLELVCDNIVMEQHTPSEALCPSVSFSHEQNASPKKRLPKVSVKILQNWLSAHSYHPYPSDTERAWLEAQTGLTSSQIANWFSNARRRQRLARSSHSMPIAATQSVPDLHATPKWDTSGPLT